MENINFIRQHNTDLRARREKKDDDKEEVGVVEVKGAEEVGVEEVKGAEEGEGVKDDGVK